MEDKKTKKVLISAYSCRPFSGSEPKVAWEFINRISKQFEIIVITRNKYKADVLLESEKFESINNIQFVFHDLPFIEKVVKHGHIGLWLYYYLWQLTSLKKIKLINKNENISLVHHLTMVNDWLPSIIWFLGKPFLWGPVGGYSFSMKFRFFIGLSFPSKVKEFFRVIIQSFFFYFEPFSVLTKVLASEVVVSSEISIKKISLFNKSIQYAPHLFIPKVNLDYRKKNKLFTIFTTGRLVYWKGLDLIIDSFLKFNSIYPKSQLLIGGKGVELKRSRIDRILKENPNIKILGYAEDLNELYKRYIDCDVFIQPSLRDGPLFTILEAMYFAKPVITLDIPSFNELIPDSFGFKIKGSSEDELVELIFKKLSYYYENPEYARLMGKKAQEFAINNYSGDKFVNIIAEIYERLGSRAT